MLEGSREHGDLWGSIDREGNIQFLRVAGDETEKVFSVPLPTAVREATCATSGPDAVGKATFVAGGLDGFVGAASLSFVDIHRRELSLHRAVGALSGPPHSIAAGLSQAVADVATLAPSTFAFTRGTSFAALDMRCSTELVCAAPPAELALKHCPGLPSWAAAALGTPSAAHSVAVMQGGCPGGKLAVGQENGVVVCWDVRMLRPQSVLLANPWGGHKVRVCSDGRWEYSGAPQHLHRPEPQSTLAVRSKKRGRVSLESVATPVPLARWIGGDTLFVAESGRKQPAAGLQQAHAVTRSAWGFEEATPHTQHPAAVPMLAHYCHGRLSALPVSALVSTAFTPSVYALGYGAAQAESYQDSPVWMALLAQLQHFGAAESFHPLCEGRCQSVAAADVAQVLSVLDQKCGESESMLSPDAEGVLVALAAPPLPVLQPQWCRTQGPSPWPSPGPMLSVSPDGQRLLHVSAIGGVQVLRAQSGEHVASCSSPLALWRHRPGSTQLGAPNGTVAASALWAPSSSQTVEALVSYDAQQVTFGFGLRDLPTLPSIHSGHQSAGTVHLHASFCARAEATPSPTRGRAARGGLLDTLKVRRIGGLRGHLHCSRRASKRVSSVHCRGASSCTPIQLATSMAASARGIRGRKLLDAGPLPSAAPSVGRLAVLRQLKRGPRVFPAQEPPPGWLWGAEVPTSDSDLAGWVMGAAGFPGLVFSSLQVGPGGPLLENIAAVSVVFPTSDAGRASGAEEIAAQAKHGTVPADVLLVPLIPTIEERTALVWGDATEWELDGDAGAEAWSDEEEEDWRLAGQEESDGVACTRADGPRNQQVFVCLTCTVSQAIAQYALSRLASLRDALAAGGHAAVDSQSEFPSTALGISGVAADVARATSFLFGTSHGRVAAPLSALAPRHQELVQEMLQSPIQPVGMCHACAGRCHGAQGHVLVELGMKQGFTCECGCRSFTDSLSVCRLDGLGASLAVDHVSADGSAIQGISVPPPLRKCVRDLCSLVQDQASTGACSLNAPDAEGSCDCPGCDGSCMRQGSCRCPGDLQAQVRCAVDAQMPLEPSDLQSMLQAAPTIVQGWKQAGLEHGNVIDHTFIGRYCYCNKVESRPMVQCELCDDWFHSACAEPRVSLDDLLHHQPMSMVCADCAAMYTPFLSDTAVYELTPPPADPVLVVQADAQQLLPSVLPQQADIAPAFRRRPQHSTGSSGERVHMGYVLLRGVLLVAGWRDLLVQEDQTCLTSRLAGQAPDSAQNAVVCARPAHLIAPANVTDPASPQACQSVPSGHRYRLSSWLSWYGAPLGVTSATQDAACMATLVVAAGRVAAAEGSVQAEPSVPETSAVALPFQQGKSGPPLQAQHPERQDEALVPSATLVSGDAEGAGMAGSAC